jgi:DNA polymerase-3 subunit epsilon
MTWLGGPLCGFDLETTGVDVEEDRIVTACVGFARQPGDWQPRTWLVNPGVLIPEQATAVHGVTDEQAAQGEDPVQALDAIDRALQAAWFAGAPVIGFNISYDLTVLDREMRRHLGRPLQVSGPVLDGLVIDKHVDPYRRGSRKLTAVCDHYGIPLGDDAHAADADAFAAVRAVYAMVRGSAVLSGMSLDDLHDRQVEWFAEQRTSFFQYLQRKGETPDNMNTVWPVAPYTPQARKEVA